MRMRNKPWAKEFLEESGVVLKLGEDDGFLWEDKPRRIEIGCGKGGFISQAALREPGVNFIGLETDANALASAVKGFYVNYSAEERPGNLRFMRGNAEMVLEYFPFAGFERIYINFCDPWRNKAGWMHRRLTHEGFLEKYEKILEKGGGVWFKTDNRDLFLFSKREFQKRGWTCGNVTEDLARSGFEGNIVTEYESRFMRQGKPIYRIEAGAPAQ